MKLRLEWIVIGVGALVLATLGYARDAASKGPPPSIFSSYDTGANGYAAWYAIAQRAGLDVRRWELPMGLLDSSVGTLVLSGYENEMLSAFAGARPPNPMSAHDVDSLKRFVNDGGRLVVLDDDFAGKDDVTPGIGASVKKNAAGAAAIVSNAFTAGVRRVSAPIDAVFPFSERQGIPLLASAPGVVAIAYRFGKGEVVAISAPKIFSNAQLAQYDNAAFAYDVLAGHGSVAFDEYVHGYDDSLSFWDALPAPVHAAIWIVLAILSVAVAGATIPFAPPVSTEKPDERSSSSYIDAIAALMRRARVPPRKDIYGR